MPWLRVDDGYDSHPKLLELTETQRWRWTRVLLHCARHRTEGNVTKSLLREVGLGAASQKLLQLGLLEPNDNGGYVVHDWALYNGATIADKVASYLSTHPDASANTVAKAIGGTRGIVLTEVEKQRTHTQTNGTNPVRPNHPTSTEPSTETGTRARYPVPSRPLPEAVALDATEPEPDNEQPTAQDIEYIQTLDLTRNIT